MAGRMGGWGVIWDAGKMLAGGCAAMMGLLRRRVLGGRWAGGG